MLGEREPVRPPTWKTALADYERALGRYEANPSLAATAFLDRARQRLDAELARDGKFPLGLVTVSADAIAVLTATGTIPQQYLVRHRNGDHGQLSADEVLDNAYAVPREYRIRSVYETPAGALEVITAGNRSHTTIDVARGGRGHEAHDDLGTSPRPVR